jgi:hypothetical protein
MIEYLDIIVLFILGILSFLLWWNSRNSIALVLSVFLFAGATTLTVLTALGITVMTMDDLLSFLCVTTPVLIGLVGILFFIKAIRSGNPSNQLIIGITIFAIAIALASYGVATPSIHTLAIINSGWWMIVLGICVIVEGAFWAALSSYPILRSFDNLTRSLFISAVALIGLAALMLGIAMVYLNIVLIPTP